MPDRPSIHTFLPTQGHHESPLPLSGSPEAIRPKITDGVPRSEEIRSRATWGKYMKDAHLQRRYKKVAVIMVYWEQDGEEGARAANEINQLKDVFKATYGYEVCDAKLEKEVNPTLQLNAYLANFVLASDKENTLMIIYYAGHGTPDYVTKRLLFARDNIDAADEKSEEMNFLVWEQAEQLILASRKADMFLIFDCCHAGKVLQTRHRSPLSERIFEFLGAAGAGETTPLPGPESFTSALIFALKELAGNGHSSREMQPFSSLDLWDTILHAPEFKYRDNQLPILIDRIHSSRKLLLEPLLNSEAVSRTFDPDQHSEEADAAKYCLYLNFLLPRIPTDDEYAIICCRLRDLIRRPEFLVQQIVWKGLYHREERLASDYGLKWANATLKARLMRTAPTTSESRTITHHGLSTPARSIRGERGHNSESQIEDAKACAAISIPGSPPSIGDCDVVGSKRSLSPRRQLRRPTKRSCRR